MVASSEYEKSSNAQTRERTAGLKSSYSWFVVALTVVAILIVIPVILTVWYRLDADRSDDAVVPLQTTAVGSPAMLEKPLLLPVVEPKDSEVAVPPTSSESNSADTKVNTQVSINGKNVLESSDESLNYSTSSQGGTVKLKTSVNSSSSGRSNVDTSTSLEVESSTESEVVIGTEP